LVDTDRQVVILELEVGLNTPSVLRRHNEYLVGQDDGKVKLLRIGKGAAGFAPLDLEEEGRAVGVEADIGHLLPSLL
jgi:hypothetical protein